MAAKKTKSELEFRLVKATLDVPAYRRLLKCRCLGQIDLVWPRTGVARKSAAREMVFHRGIAEFGSEPLGKRVVFREEIDRWCAVAFAITEPVSVQKFRRFLRLTAKYAFKMGADFMEKAMVGYADIASAPIDAIAAMVGEKDVPEVLASGVVDFTELPDEGGEVVLKVPLCTHDGKRAAGELELLVRG